MGMQTGTGSDCTQTGLFRRRWACNLHPSPFAFVMLVAALAAVVALAGCAKSQQQESQPESSSSSSYSVDERVKVVTADDVLALEDDAYLVDTRTYEEFVEGHIPSALNASYPKETGGACAAEQNESSFRANWAKLDIPEDAHVVLYCRTGHRASLAASALLEDGYTNVDLYQGSWTDWITDPSRPKETV